ncbi:MAG: hypothetical protein JWM11_3085, partial [Planctomycetaceae bacterium]|nr:hypothetical protein [Planctomycetaceae bacterium]
SARRSVPDDAAHDERSRTEIGAFDFGFGFDHGFRAKCLSIPNPGVRWLDAALHLIEMAVPENQDRDVQT